VRVRRIISIHIPSHNANDFRFAPPRTNVSASLCLKSRDAAAPQGFAPRQQINWRQQQHPAERHAEDAIPRKARWSNDPQKARWSSGNKINLRQQQHPAERHAEAATLARLAGATTLKRLAEAAT